MELSHIESLLSLYTHMHTILISAGASILHCNKAYWCLQSSDFPWSDSICSCAVARPAQHGADHFTCSTAHLWLFDCHTGSTYVQMIILDSLLWFFATVAIRPNLIHWPSSGPFVNIFFSMWPLYFIHWNLVFNPSWFHNQPLCLLRWSWPLSRRHSLRCCPGGSLRIFRCRQRKCSVSRHRPSVCRSSYWSQHASVL